MLKLLKFLKNYRKESILSPVFKLVEVAFELTIPLLVANIIDRGIGLSDKPYIIKMSLLMVLFGVLGLACTLMAQYFAAKASVGFATDVRKNLFDHISRLSFSQLDEMAPPHL